MVRPHPINTTWLAAARAASWAAPKPGPHPPPIKPPGHGSALAGRAKDRVALPGWLHWLKFSRAVHQYLVWFLQGVADLICRTPESALRPRTLVTTEL